MRFRGEIIDAKHTKGISAKGESYEAFDYILLGQDAQGHYNKFTFRLYNEKGYEHKIVKGDNVEISFMIDAVTTENGSIFNRVVKVYFVQKLNDEGKTTKEALIEKQAEKDSTKAETTPQVPGSEKLPF